MRSRNFKRTASRSASLSPERAFRAASSRARRTAWRSTWLRGTWSTLPTSTVCARRVERGKGRPGKRGRSREEWKLWNIGICINTVVQEAYVPWVKGHIVHLDGWVIVRQRAESQVEERGSNDIIQLVRWNHMGITPLRPSSPPPLPFSSQGTFPWHC